MTFDPRNTVTLAWTRDGIQILTATSADATSTLDLPLTVSSAADTDAGAYKCAVSTQFQTSSGPLTAPAVAPLTTSVTITSKAIYDILLVYTHLFC